MAPAAEGMEAVQVSSYTACCRFIASLETSTSVRGAFGSVSASFRSSGNIRSASSGSGSASAGDNNFSSKSHSDQEDRQDTIAQQLGLTAAQEAKCLNHLQQAAALATVNLEDFQYKDGLATQPAASPLQRPRQQLGNTQIISVPYSAADPTSSTCSTSNNTEVAGVGLAERQHLSAVACRAARGPSATMPTHFLPAAVYIVQALVTG